MEHGVHLALPSTSCITTSRCSDVTIRAWKYSPSSSVILYNALFCSQVPQLFSYFEIPFTERQSCSCAMTKLSGLKILQNSASKQLQHYRIVHMALLDTLLHFSPPLKLMKYVSNQRRLHNVEVTLSIHIYLGAPSLAIACASTLQIRYNGHNSGLKTGSWTKYKIPAGQMQNSSWTNTKYQLQGA